MLSVTTVARGSTHRRRIARIGARASAVMSDAGGMTADDNPRRTGLEIAHVLVPLDGSELALKAVPTARVLAERFAAELHSVSVAGDDEDPDRLRSAASAALGAGPGDERAFVVAGGDPAAGIASRARELGSCLVCLSSQGRGRVGGAVIGSVARSGGAALVRTLGRSGAVRRQSGMVAVATARTAVGSRGSSPALTGPTRPSRCWPWRSHGPGSSACR